MNITTQQQEAGFEEWQQVCIENEEIDIETLSFENWYFYYCLENSFFWDGQNLMNKQENEEI